MGVGHHENQAVKGVSNPPQSEIPPKIMKLAKIKVYNLDLGRKLQQML